MYSILQVFPVFPLASISFHQPKPPHRHQCGAPLLRARVDVDQCVGHCLGITLLGWSKKWSTAIEIYRNLKGFSIYHGLSWFVMIYWIIIWYICIYIHTQCWVIHVVNMHKDAVPGHLAIPGYQHFPVRLVEMQSSNWGPDPLAKAPRGPRHGNSMELAWLWMMW